MTTSTHQFALNQQVTIREIETKGMIRSVRIDIQGTMYYVSYWLDGELCQEWLHEDELDA